MTQTKAARQSSDPAGKVWKQIGIVEPTVQQKKEWGWRDTAGPTIDTDAQLKAEIDRMWGYIGDERRGWKICQFVREGRILLRPEEFDSVCNNRAVRGEKYCAEHMPHIPNRTVWFLIGAATMWALVYFKMVSTASWIALALFLLWLGWRCIWFVIEYFDERAAQKYIRDHPDQTLAIREGVLKSESE